MNRTTYNKISAPQANVEKLLELWESFGATGLFRLEVEFEGGISNLAHLYHLKNTNIVIKAFSNSKNHYQLAIYDGEKEISSDEFWNRIPKEIQKVLAFHLDQLII